MGPVLSLILIGASIVIAVGAMAVWLAIKRPARSMERRHRDEALAAADRYTPAPRRPPYGAPAQPADPCAPGLSDAERVQAMRTLLVRGDAGADKAGVEADADQDFVHTQPAADHDVMTTTPKASKPTLLPDDAEALENRRARRTRVHEGRSVTMPVD